MARACPIRRSVWKGSGVGMTGPLPVRPVTVHTLVQVRTATTPSRKERQGFQTAARSCVTPVVLPGPA